MRAIAIINIEDEYHHQRHIGKINGKPQNPKWKVDGIKLYKFVRRNELSFAESDWKRKKLRLSVLIENHHVYTAGHSEYFKTRKRIANTYYWPKMNTDVAVYIRNCHVCNSIKPEQKLPHGKMNPRDQGIDFY